MSVKAKFKYVRYEASSHKKKIDEKGPWVDSNLQKEELRTLIFQPVYGNSDPEHENTKFFNATPSGEIKLGTVNPEAWKFFDLDEEYLLTFEKAE